MEAVAERAGVSRPLVYKHFANRDELVAAASRREAAELHLDLAMEVAASSSVEDMSRALLRGSLRATVERPDLQRPPCRGRVEPRHPSGATVERPRTVRAFAAVAARQYGLERRCSVSVTAVPLGALDAVLAQWRIDPTEDNKGILEETYLAMVVGAYSVESAGGRARDKAHVPCPR